MCLRHCKPKIKPQKNSNGKLARVFHLQYLLARKLETKVKFIRSEPPQCFQVQIEKSDKLAKREQPFVNDSKGDAIPYHTIPQPIIAHHTRLVCFKLNLPFSAMFLFHVPFV